MLLHWHDLLDILMFQIYSSCLCLSCLGPLVNNIPKTVEICVLQNLFTVNVPDDGYSYKSCALDEISTLVFFMILEYLFNMD